jgi:tetratricopeptide (TPR) repeat protein
MLRDLRQAEDKRDVPPEFALPGGGAPSSAPPEPEESALPAKEERPVDRPRRDGATERRNRWTFGIVPPPAAAFQHRRVAAELARAVVERSRQASNAGEPLTLSGPSGAGKTQLAADLARRLWSTGEIDILIWVDATSRDAVLSLFRLTSTASGSTQFPDASDVVAWWWDWLSSSGKRWLVVFDDLRETSDVDDLLPLRVRGGHVLVTTRLPGRGGRPVIEVGSFTPAESEAFLVSRLAGRARQATGAAELAHELGHWPTALAQAVAQIRDRTALTCASYRRLWLVRHLALSQDRAEVPRDHRATMATTTSLAVDLANSLNPVGLARPLLGLMSLCDSNGVPEAVLTAPAVLAHLSAAAGREVASGTVADALSCLHRLSLVSHAFGGRKAVRVHAVVQQTIREALDDEPLAACARAVADALVQVWPGVERNAEFSTSLRTNTYALRDSADGALWDPKAHDVLFRVGQSVGAAGQAKAAIEYYGLLCETATRRLGADHPDTLQARHNLAHWRGEAGDVEGMTAALRQVLADIERVLGEDHPSALTTRHNLAYAQAENGDVVGAVAALEHVLLTQERVLGEENPDALTTHLSLARWLGEAGHAQRAVDEFQRVLASLERVLGLDHPETLTARHGLARWLGETGDAERAVGELEQVLADQQRVLGADSPDALTTRHNLAYWRSESGDAAGAVSELNQVLASQTKVLGPYHPDTLTTHHNLAFSRGELGDPEQAVAALERVVAAQTHVMGPDHPRTRISRQSLLHWRERAVDRRIRTPAPGARTSEEATVHGGQTNRDG